jgi:hypothetical protein
MLLTRVPCEVMTSHIQLTDLTAAKIGSRRSWPRTLAANIIHSGLAFISQPV